MHNLNYKHLRYFWMVASSGSIAKASEQLHLTPQSISGQLRELEESLGVSLFKRAGRGLEVTDSGRAILSYAEEIFALGDELYEAVKNQKNKKALPFKVGITDSVPKTIAYRLVEPAIHLPEEIKLICREGRLAPLLAELAVHNLDMVIADRSMPANINVRGFNHLLGESSMTVFASPTLTATIKGKFPQNLNNMPFLLPGEDVAIRTKLMRWFEENRINVRIVGEFDDGALLKAFGQAGAGFFVGPTAIKKDIEKQYHVKAIGEIDSISEQIYAITTERRLTHPAIVAISEIARKKLFGQ